MAELPIPCACAAELHKEVSVGIELLHEWIAIIGHVDIAVLIRGDSDGAYELTIARPFAAPSQKEAAIFIEFLDAVIAIIDDKDIVTGIDCQAAESQRLELTVPAALRLPPGLELALVIEDQHSAVARIRDVDRALRVDGDPVRIFHSVGFVGNLK